MKYRFAVLAGTLALGAGSVEATTVPTDATEISEAAAECDATSYLQDDGHSIVFDGISTEEMMADPVVELFCVVGELLPEFMINVFLAAASMEEGLFVTEVDGLVVVTGRYPARYPGGDIFLVIYEADHDYPNV